MNSRALYAAGGGIAAAAIAIFFVLGPGIVRLPGSQSDQGSAQSQLQDLELSINNITATKTDEQNADVKITFDVRNPNRNTALLETIHYSIYIDEVRMTFGDIGVSPEGFLASQEGIFPIVANSTVALKDTRVAARNNLTASSWDAMVQGMTQYRVEGMYSYKLTGTAFQFSAGEKDFILTYP